VNSGGDFQKPAPGNYERPNAKWRCGRISTWDKPCHAGPRPDGSCGGTSECNPVRTGDRFECRRTATAGGPCTQGPRPDGTCSQTRPPCVPQPTLRTYRSRFSLLALVLTVALIAALGYPRPDDSTHWNSMDPGPLSGNHARFIGKGGCVACHLSHQTGATGWLRATFTPHDMTSRCVACHTFDGPETRPHNEMFKQREDLSDTTCVMCHTEHMGETFSITRMTDAQCNSCHRVKFDSFSRGHPAFAAGYPQAVRNINFDHNAHLGQYFADPKFATRTPTCATCHLVTSGEARVRTQGFEKACAACHTEQIRQNHMVLLRLPEGGARALQKATVDDATAFMAYLLEDPSDDQAYAKRLHQLVPRMGKTGVAPLASVLDLRAGGSFAPGLLASLNPEVIASALEESPPGGEVTVVIKEPPQGWYWRVADGEELCYKPAGHADPVVRAWLEFGIDTVARAGDTDPNDRAMALHDELLHSRDGVGRCIKCHTISSPKTADAGVKERIEWHSQSLPSHIHTRFSHGTHLPLLSCTACHTLNRVTESGVQSQNGGSTGVPGNFKSIRKEACMECHGVEGIRQDCQLCHAYHREAFFRKRPWAESSK